LPLTIDHNADMSALIEIRLKDECELLRAAREGSSEALGELVRRHHQDIRAFLTRYLFDRSIVDDIAQEVFLSAVTGIQTLQDDNSAKAWLMSIARFKAIDYLRAKTRNPTETSDDIDSLLTARQLARMQDLHETSDDRTEIVTTLRNCIDQLSGTSRNLVVQYYFQRTSAESLAQTLNRKPGTVRMALLRIRKSLAKCIKSQLGSKFDGTFDGPFDGPFDKEFQS